MIFIHDKFCLGIIRQYIREIYTETKKRPYYIVNGCSDKQIKN